MEQVECWLNADVRDFVIFQWAIEAGVAEVKKVFEDRRKMIRLGLHRSHLYTMD